MRKQFLGIGAVASAALAMGLFGTATASADYAGETYADASEAIEEDGGTPVVAARVGDKLETDDCIVTHSWDASFMRIDESDDSEVMLALNCAGEYATATNPGASVASPLGREAKTKAEEEAAKAEEEELAEAATPDE